IAGSRTPRRLRFGPLSTKIGLGIDRHLGVAVSGDARLRREHRQRGAPCISFPPPAKGCGRDLYDSHEPLVVEPNARGLQQTLQPSLRTSETCLPRSSVRFSGAPAMMRSPTMKWGVP